MAYANVVDLAIEFCNFQVHARLLPGVLVIHTYLLYCVNLIQLDYSQVQQTYFRHIAKTWCL